MKHLITILFYALSTQVSASTQYPDILLYEGDTLMLYSYPLEEYLSQKGSRILSGTEMQGSCTALVRGYVATWEMRNDSLFLVKVEIGKCNTPTPIDLSAEFETAKVFAAWVSSELFSPSGKRIYFHSLSEPVFEYDRVFMCERGSLVRIYGHDNTVSPTDSVAPTTAYLSRFFYQTIDWELVNQFDLAAHAKVVARVSVNAEGKVEEIQIEEGGINSTIKGEIERVIHLIPKWCVHYSRGNPLAETWTIPIHVDRNFYR